MYLIGDLKYASVYTAVSGLRKNMLAMCIQSKLRHMYVSKLSAMYSWVFCKFLLELCCCQISRNSKTCSKYQFAAEAELNYYYCSWAKLFLCKEAGNSLLWGCTKIFRVISSLYVNNYKC